MNRGLFPLPLLIREDEYDGLLVQQDELCRTCPHRACMTERKVEPHTSICNEGLNYVWIASDVLIRGIVIDGGDRAGASSALGKSRHKKRVRAGKNTISHADYIRYVAGLSDTIIADAENQRCAIVEAAKKEVSEAGVATSVSKWMDERGNVLARGIAHDHMQLLSAIFQNIDYVLEARYGEDALSADMPRPKSLDAGKARTVWQREKAILVSCEVMALGLRAADLIRGSPGEIETEERNPHKLFFKVSQLIHEKARNGGVHIQLGPWWLDAILHAEQEVALLPVFALMDNAVKYAPRNSQVSIEFSESPRGTISCRVISFGPRIDLDERTCIFDAEVRGRHAAASAVHGGGIGLWQASLAARGWATIAVQQDDTPSLRYTDRFRTQFVLEVRAAVRRD